MAAAVWAGFAPLADPDLPMHLAVGEWIFTRQRVPFEEPFAWTRPGEPYYAYSWLAQVVFYATMRLAGPVGLHVLAAVVGASIVLAGFAAGRAMALSASRSTILGVLSIFIAMESTPFLRPQLIMHALIPLAWAAALTLARKSSRVLLPAIALWLLSALAAGVHITFLLAAAPLALLWAQGSASDPRRELTASAAVLIGWFTSPYALRWPDVFALNLGYDAILSGPSPPGELSPGFAVSPLVGAALAVQPLLIERRSARTAERLALALLWLAGLLLFARYFKGLGPWWWCALPIVCMVLSRLPSPSDRRVELWWAALVPVALLALSPTNVRLWMATRVYEGGLEARSLPSLKGFATEPIASWLESHAVVPRGTKLLTTTSYGSYLKWRIPALSESIDTRSVFPDSVALPDVPSTAADRPLGPWQSSDLAVVPESYPVAEVLDHNPDWQRIGTAVPAPWALTAPRAGLWARRSWIAVNVRAPLGASSAVFDLPARRAMQ
jgi:hypothetical protein